MPIRTINRLTFVMGAPCYTENFLKLNNLSNFICHAR